MLYTTPRNTMLYYYFTFANSEVNKLYNITEEFYNYGASLQGITLNELS
jgi:hypothetical protein